MRPNFGGETVRYSRLAKGEFEVVIGLMGIVVGSNLAVMGRKTAHSVRPGIENISGVVLDGYGHGRAKT